jgi:hypothetical protein
VSAVAAVAAVATSGSLTALGALATGIAWWVREGRAERAVDEKQVAVRAEVAALPHGSIVLPPDRARNRAAAQPRFVGYRVWPVCEVDTVELAIVKRTVAAIEAGGAS